MKNLKKGLSITLLISIVITALGVFGTMPASAADQTYNRSNTNQLLVRSNGQTTPFFTVGEVRCQHGGKACPTTNFTFDSRLVDILHGIRTHFNKPVIITSGFRCTTHNKNEGGATNSNHTIGRGVDIKIQGVTRAQILTVAKNLGAGADTGYHGTGNPTAYTHIAVAATSFKSIPYAAPTRTLKVISPMMSGNDVRYVQWCLNKLGYSPGSIDGWYGTNTGNAVRRWQAANGLVQDGIFGPASKSKMIDVMASKGYR